MPLLALGGELQRRGHEIHVLLPEEMKDLAPTGMIVHADYYSDWQGDGQSSRFSLPRDDVRSVQAKTAFAAQQASAAHAYRALLEKVVPDVVVADTTSTYVNESSGEHSVVWHSPTFVTQEMIGALHQGADRPSNEEVLVAVAPLLHLPVPDEMRLRFIGPLSAPIARSASPSTVFISAGTSYNEETSLLFDAILALEGLPYQPVVATGDAGAATKLQRWFPDARISAWVDQLSILSDSAAFISTGGMGSLQQAAAAGVPTIVVPQSAEQSVNASMLADLGCAVSITPEVVTPDLLTRAILHVTTAASVSSASSSLKKHIEGLGGASEGADIIERIGRDQ